MEVDKTVRTRKFMHMIVQASEDLRYHQYKGKRVDADRMSLRSSGPLKAGDILRDSMRCIYITIFTELFADSYLHNGLMVVVPVTIGATEIAIVPEVSPLKPCYLLQ
jgi:hypothetical protein